MVFIDTRNVIDSVDMIESLNMKADFEALTNQLVSSRELIAAYIFDTRMPVGEDDTYRKFHDKLRYTGFRVIAREYDVNLREQKEVDVAMACEMVVHALRDHYDVAIVVSGDRDFIPAIQHVQSAGKRVEVAAFANSVSKEMKRSADRFYELEKMPVIRMSNPVLPEAESAEAV